MLLMLRSQSKRRPRRKTSTSAFSVDVGADCDHSGHNHSQFSVEVDVFRRGRRFYCDHPVFRRPFSVDGKLNLFRFASLYGIGKALNRTPYYDTYYECVVRLYKEIQDSFPNYRKFLRLEHRANHEKNVVEFGKHCCRYDDPNRLASVTSQYLELTSIHLQSYKYFEHAFDEVREMFSFSTRLKAKIDSYSGQLFGNDTNHKLCVHTRRGDFANTNTESKGQLTEKATQYAASFLQEKYGNISVVLLGKDKQFLHAVNLTREVMLNTRTVMRGKCAVG
ncbi:galactoside 2-alpha-L-fucosyltransferase [Ditylenchus destructor]|nr:galactoside 2-alpha-L-fucosyltransferase [Ditylenchus destructor]